MRLDERVEPERRRASRRARGRRVVEVAQEQQRRVGARVSRPCAGRSASRRSPWRAAAASSPRARRAGRPSEPPKRSSTSTDIARAPRRARSAGDAATSPSGRRSPADGERRLNSAIAPKPGAASASWNAHAAPPALRERDELARAARRPRPSRAPRARAETLAQVGRVAARGDRAGGVQQDRRAAAAVPRPSKTSRIARAFSAGVAAARARPGRSAGRRGRAGRSRARAPRPSTTSQTRFGPAGESSSMPPRAVHDERAARAELREHVGDRRARASGE